MNSSVSVPSQAILGDSFLSAFEELVIELIALHSILHWIAFPSAIGEERQPIHEWADRRLFSYASSSFYWLI